MCAPACPCDVLGVRRCAARLWRLRRGPRDSGARRRTSQGMRRRGACSGRVVAERVLGASRRTACPGRAHPPAARALGARVPPQRLSLWQAAQFATVGRTGLQRFAAHSLYPDVRFFDVWSKYPNCAPRWGAVSLCIDERLITSQIVSVQSCVHPCGGRLDGFTASLRLRESLGFVRAWVDVRRAMRVF